MEIYSTEEQQVDAIKQFWKDYGASIVIGAVVGLGGLYGWNTYSDMKVTAAEDASESFQTIVAQSTNPAALLVQAESFATEHDSQGYQSLLELMVAKSAVEAGDLAKAEASFTKVIAAEPGSGLGMVAMIRLARIQAEQDNLGMALATLEQVTDKAFSSQREELKGDFLVRQGDLDKAKLAYQAAVDNGGALTSPALTMKLDNLNKA
ncbi:tetratricopeptide repeat protein [Shewanella polaris]|uniref:Ancillary SecYEG translocon subunit n=1 Tax=Shewanella polaris TaxID=2588449 RepID=A0A4Y5YHG9_9GAMM|nr:tetratricopeptide repeat protein [Shewanella polaris]QDE32055.1 tetratricopeptide repeat protein [Shewanella polaris]